MLATLSNAPTFILTMCQRPCDTNSGPEDIRKGRRNSRSSARPFEAISFTTDDEQNPDVPPHKSSDKERLAEGVCEVYYKKDSRRCREKSAELQCTIREGRRIEAI
ncbi:Hypothetical protein NTJ_02331 [Nesidiocoris tenuis]|uniref:Uncharacterized protein n=2 Tax=Nesidiocoris tenuis TaxID=355587 RepID=A0ABN7ABW3_9HEMI|nr:Hypothetical protein NTJ_02331 [Nesidiocoris tenuis]